MIDTLINILKCSFIILGIMTIWGIILMIVVEAYKGFKGNKGVHHDNKL